MISVPQSPGLCACGCGQATPLARRNDTKRGYVKGQPTRYVAGHNLPHPSHARAPIPPPNTTVLCACGCGQPTKRIAHNAPKRGYVQDQPIRYLHGHNPTVGTGARPPQERFWEDVDQSGGPDACWPWTGYIAPRTGYGRFFLGKGHTIHAHRYALEQRVGPLPSDTAACHRCDNKPCCNPAHLFAGSAQENRADCVAKGRQSRGSRSGTTHLTEAQVLEIRARYVPKQVTLTLLAREYHISPATVSCIIRRKNWRHI